LTLEVAVKDLLLMEVRHGNSDLLGQSQDGVLVQLDLFLVNYLKETASLDELSDHVVVVFSVETNAHVKYRVGVS
jgi:hypothetical protein